MEKRRLGNSDLFTNPLIFGGNVLGWTLNEKQSFEVLDAFVASGFNMIDTADVYVRWATGNGGESETIIGEWLKKRKNRNSVIIATKVGMDMGNGNIGLSKKHILKSVESSLKRMQTDHIDLYQSHKDDASTPIEETLDAYEQLIKEGKIRWIGASNFSAERLQQSLDISKKHNLPRYQSLQPHYNLYERSIFEGDLEKVCVENQLGVINYYPLASGFLTGKYKSENDLSKSVRGGGVTKFMNDKGFKILDALDEVAARHKATPASVTLAWYMARPSVTAPISSATSVSQVQDLAQAATIQLTQQDIDLIDSCSTY